MQFLFDAPEELKIEHQGYLGRHFFPREKCAKISFALLGKFLSGKPIFSLLTGR